MTGSLTLFLIILVSYYAYVPLFSMAPVLGLLAPFVLLKFLQENRISSLYPILGVAFFLGLILFPAYLTAYYILTVLIPVLVMYLSHNSFLYNGRQLHIPNKHALLIAPIAVFIASAVGLLIFKEYAAELQANVAMIIEKAIAPTFTSDVVRLDPNNSLASIYNRREIVAEYVVGLIPAMLYCYVYTVLFFTEKVYYKREGITKLPDSLVWVVAASGLCVVIPIPEATMHGLNGLLVMGVLYFFRGFDIIQFKLLQWKLSFILRFIIFFLILTQMLFIAAVAILGFASVYIDFTKPKKTTKE